MRELSPSVTYLYMDYVRSIRAWPWTETALAAQVLEKLAYLHARIPSSHAASIEPAWDYDADLAESASLTLELFERTARQVDLAWLSWVAVRFVDWSRQYPSYAEPC